MARVSVPNPRKAAASVSSVDEAAELRDMLEVDLFADDLPAGFEDDANGVLAELERRFPQLPQIAFGESSFADPDGPGKRARRYKQSGRATTRTGRNRPERPPAAPRRRSGGARGGSTGRSRRRTGRYSAPALVTATGAPGAAWSVTQLVMYGVGGLVGLSVLYLVLQRSGSAPAGQGPAELFSRGLTEFFTRVLGPVDPLSGKASPATNFGGIIDRRAAGAAPAR